jgi:hypothetical protein
MERKHPIHRLARRTLTCVGLPLALFALVGCGSEVQRYKNDTRPPTPINVAAYVSADRVSVSPTSFGAGPIVVVVTNQSSDSQELTFEGDGGGSGNVQQSTGPINPGDTGELKVFVDPGSYTLRASSGGVAPATVTVGAERESAQNKVLQP